MCVLHADLYYNFSVAGGSLEDSSPAFYNILSYKTLLSHPVWVAPCLENFPPKSTDIVVYIHLERDFKESKKDLLCSVPCDATQKCSFYLLNPL